MKKHFKYHHSGKGVVSEYHISKIIHKKYNKYLIVCDCICCSTIKDRIKVQLNKFLSWTIF